LLEGAIYTSAQGQFRRMCWCSPVICHQRCEHWLVSQLQ